MCTDPLIIEEFAEKRLGDEPCGKFTKYWRGQLEADADLRELYGLPTPCLGTGKLSTLIMEIECMMACIGVEGGSNLYEEFLKYVEEQNKL